MKYLRFCIFLLILSTIVSVYPNEALQSFRLLDNTNCTLENGVPNYYTTYCYTQSNCTNKITFYPNSNQNSSVIIELGTQFSNYNISLNTSYTVNSNVELMPITQLIPVGQVYYQIIKMLVINLTSETSSMNVWDAMDHVVRSCEVASGGIIAWVFVVLDRTYTYTPDGLALGTVISICGWNDPIGAQSVLYIVFGWDCFPQYILYDELSPLNLITLLLDCYVFFLLKLAKLNDQQKRREKVLKLFIVMDLIDVSYSCLRRMLLFVYLHNSFLGYQDFSSQWSMFYYNAYARYIILALYDIDNHFFYVIRLIFYAVEMVVCQVLMRRIQAVENPHYVPKNFVDRFLLKLTKKFYTRVLRVQPTTMINNTTNIVG